MGLECEDEVSELASGTGRGGGWELQKRGRRRGHKVEVSELDLELQ